jgi:hydrogenase-4 component B
MILVVTADNALLFLIVWEAMSLLSYFLVVFEHEKPENVHAGFVYLVMTHVGTAFLVLLFLLFYQQSGSFDFATFRSATGSLPEITRTLAFVFALIGFGTKAGLVPLHIWLPYAHPAAPSHVSALMSGVMIKTAIYGMLRVFFDFLAPQLVWWWGLVVLMLASISAVLGVLYALMEHDIKKLLAYHSVENNGIILIGVGLAMIFASYQVAPNLIPLAALAAMAALYHLINHAVFKGLLFLGAGAVVSQTHTRNIEALGGLIKLMPWTAAFFLIGAVAISALPPLNGFISEWLTFQALLLGLRVPTLIVKIIVPLSAALLAMSGALAAACFVKAFGITFLALPRSEHAKNAREVPKTMRIGMGLLAGLTVALGLLPIFVIPLLDRVTASLLGSSVGPQVLFNSLTVAPLNPGIATYAPLGLTFILFFTLPVALGIALLGGAVRLRRAQTWGCGLPQLSSRMEYTATGFSKPIRLIFKNIYQPRKQVEIETDVSSYVHKRIRYELQIEAPFEKYFYGPLSTLIMRASRGIRQIQTGSINVYLAYIFIALVILLLLVR